MQMYKGEGMKSIKKSKKYDNVTKDAIIMHIQIGQNKVYLKMITRAFTNFQELNSEYHSFATLSYTSFCYFTYLYRKLTLCEPHFQSLAF